MSVDRNDSFLGAGVAVGIGVALGAGVAVGFEVAVGAGLGVAVATVLGEGVARGVGVGVGPARRSPTKQHAAASADSTPQYAA